MYQASSASAHLAVRRNHGETPRAAGGQSLDGTAPPLIVASILREEGNTGVQTHVRQLRRYLAGTGAPAALVTPFSWGRALAVPVFGFRLALERFSGSANVAWYRHWHEVFLRKALRLRLAQAGDCVIYAQCPLAARAALRARQGRHQRVVMAVHFRVSQADEWADKNQIRRGGARYSAIRKLERDVIPLVDGLVYVSEWGRDALLRWLPEASRVPDAVFGNFVADLPPEPGQEPLGDLATTGHLEPVKNHAYLLEVLREAKRTGHSLTLDIFGDGPLQKELTEQAGSLGIEGQVRFQGFRPDVRSFLPRYRAYVHASYSESLPLAIIEAMAAGLPVIAGDVGGISELCDEGVEGRFWPLDDAAAAAVLLTGLLDSEPTRLMMASAARKRFQRDFDADVVGPRLMSFLLRG
jgi:glycosyltransferase involved in cell wall biosynthesis